MRLVAYWVAALARARKLEFLMSDFMVAVAKRSWTSASLVCALFCSMFGPALIFFFGAPKGPAVVAVCMREEGTPATQHVVHLQMRVITEPLDFWSSRCAANFEKVEGKRPTKLRA